MSHTDARYRFEEISPHVGVAHKSSVVLDGNYKRYIEYKADRPRNPCGHTNLSPNPKTIAH